MTIFNLKGAIAWRLNEFGTAIQRGAGRLDRAVGPRLVFRRPADRRSEQGGDPRRGDVSVAPGEHVASGLVTGRLTPKDPTVSHLSSRLECRLTTP